MTRGSRLFAILPAAGRSRRMGRPKLLLPLGCKTVIAQVLAALRAAPIETILVVVRPDDEPLRQAVTDAGATALQPPIPPVDMRQSVQFALEFLEKKYAPQATDGWLLIPGDHPLLDPAVIERLLVRWDRGDCRILVPVHGGQRGHPTLFPWTLARDVPDLPERKGLNQLVRDHNDQVTEIEVDSPHVLLDLDTPEDYAKLCRQWNEQQP